MVIDVLRMTSTAATLMRRPACAHVAVAATLEDLPGLAIPASACVVVSELLSAAWPGAWVDNSPARVSDMDFEGRTPVLVTTNGTRALLAAAACADEVLLASFVDLHAVARYIDEQAITSLALLPAGHFVTGEARIEDDLCADALASLVSGDEPDLATMADRIRADARVRRRVEQAPSFSADVDLALTSDPGARVLQFHALGAAVGRIARA